MTLEKRTDNAGIFASGGCSTGCEIGCTAAKRPTAELNANTKVHGAMDHSR